ncbi:MAG: hypothetical protein AAGE52_19185 [Myxococcota bacterium]
MEITVRFDGLDSSGSALGFVVDRCRSVLGRFSSHLRGVRLVFAEDGGRQRQVRCRAAVHLESGDHVLVTRVCNTPYSAAGKALRSVRSVVAQKVGRGARAR